MSNIYHPTMEEFNQLKKEGIVLVDFFATWCGPCKMLGPELEKLADQFVNQAKIVKIDVDEYGALANEYQIQSVPTMILFKNGQPVQRVSGYRPFAELVKLLNQAM